MAGSGNFLQERLISLTQERDRLNDQIHQLENSGRGNVETGSQAKRVALTTCGHSCGEHVALMNPELWSTLPKEVLHLVFARLPLPHIMHLQCLSKEWKWNVTAKESDFRRTCASTQAKMFAMVSELSENWGVFSVRVYDLDSNKWHYLQIMHPEWDLRNFHTVSASDGGLMCFFQRLRSTEEGHGPMMILVCNPLTREVKVLPPGPVTGTDPPRMAQLVMDRGGKSYRVIVVVGKHIGAQIYDSATGTWSCTDFISEPIFGYQYHWEGGDEEVWREGTRPGLCAFGCDLLELDDQNNPCKSLASVKSYALVGDRLFVLHKKESEHRISEYHGQYTTRLNWVKLRVHWLGRELAIFPSASSYNIRLHACNDFLLLLASNDEHGDFRQDLVWLYDLSLAPSGWRQLPDEVFEQEPTFDEDRMCALRWDAVP